MSKSSHTKTRRNQEQALIAALGMSPDIIQAGVEEFMESFKKVVLQALLQSEVNELAGLPYQRSEERRCAGVPRRGQHS